MIAQRVESRGLSFTIPGRIGGKQRAGRKHLPGGKVRSFNPKQTVSQEAIVRQIAAVEMRGRKLMAGPVGVEITVWRVPPKSWSAKKRAAAFWVTGKPDVDNTQKLIYDALNGIVWLDDAQISKVDYERRYSHDSGERIDVKIMELGP